MVTHVSNETRNESAIKQKEYFLDLAKNSIKYFKVMSADYPKYLLSVIFYNIISTVCNIRRGNSFRAPKSYNKSESLSNI